MKLLPLRISARVLAVVATVIAAVAVPAAYGQPALPRPSTPDTSQQPFVFEEITTRFRFERDGRGFKEVRILVKAQSDLGVRQLGQMAFLYTPDSQGFKVPLLEVRKADGTLLRPGNSAITDEAVQPGAGINTFQDLRQTHVTVPSLSVGDAVAVHLLWTTHTPLAEGHFWFEHAFTKVSVVLDERLELDLPESVTPTIRVIPGAPSEASALKGMVEGGRRILRWKTSNLELARENTDDKPVGDEEEVAVSDVRVSTFEKWDSIVTWYDKLATPVVMVDDKVRAKALELTRGATNEDERIQSLYDFVSTQIRYVSLSFGLGRYAPHPAVEVLTNQYGDCKDKHTLLAAMLKAIGIEALPVLANAARKIDRDMPSPAEFDHLFTVLPRGKNPADWLWLDTTPGAAPYGWLLQNLRDRDVVVVSPRGQQSHPAQGAIFRTPADPPFALSTDVEVTGRIDALGALRGTVRYTTRNDEEIVLRSLLLNLPADKHIEAAKSMAAVLKLDGEVSDFKATNLDSTRLPLTVEFKVRRPGFFKWTAGGATLSLPLGPMQFPYENEDDWKKRTHGKIGSPSQSTLRVTLELPANYTPVVPVGIKISRDGLDFASTYRVAGGRVEAERLLRFKRREIVAASAPEYLAFVRAIRADEAQTVEVAFDATATPEVPSDATAPELYSAGNDAFKNKRYDVALAYWTAVVKLAPKDNSAWDALGLAYEKLKRPADAIEAFRKQTEVSPFHNQAFKDLARVLKNLDRYDEARTALAKHVEITPLDGNALKDLGELLVDDSEYAGAAVHLEKAVALLKNDAWAHATLGAAYAGLKAPEKARVSFEQAIRIAPSPGLWTYAGWALARHGIDLPWAEELTRTTLTRAAGTMKPLTMGAVTEEHRDLAEHVGWSWDAIGWIHFHRGDWAQAERYVKAAWTLTGKPGMIDHLGQIYEKQGRLADAGSAYLMALGLDESSKPFEERARRLLGKTADLKKLVSAAPRTVEPARISYDTPVDGRAELTVLVRPNGSVADVLFGKGDESMRALVPTIRTTTFPVQFPDDLIGQLPLNVRILCRSKPSECWAGLLPARDPMK